MKKLNQIITEGVYDPGIFKAFFLAGGPGSGKTFVTRSAFAGTGLKLVNSDSFFERGLKKAGLSLKMPDVEAYFRDIVRAKAKMTTATALDTYMQEELFHGRAGAKVEDIQEKLFVPLSETIKSINISDQKLNELISVSNF